MENSRTGGETWGVPFQRSTIVLYWNKDAFREAGLDPERGPANWDEHVAFGKKLTKRDSSGNATQWGTQIPAIGFPYWLFQALATEAGTMLTDEAGNHTFFDKPELIEALQYWADLSQKHKCHAAGHRRMGHDTEGFLRDANAQ